MGIVSCLGNSLDEVSTSLREAKSGITISEKYQEIGMKSHVCGRPDLDPSEFIDRKQIRFMGDNCKYAYIAMQQAVEDSLRHVRGRAAMSDWHCSGCGNLNW